MLEDFRNDPINVKEIKKTEDNKQLLKSVAFPAIIERDEINEDYYYVKCPDIEECEVFGIGFYEAILEAQNMLNLYLSKEKYKNVKPSTKDKLSKRFPNKKIYFITPVPKFYNEITSSASCYQVLKLVKSNEKNFNSCELIEIIDPFNKIILYLTLLKQADFLEGYETKFIIPCIDKGEKPVTKNIDKLYKSLIKTTPTKNDELRNLLYSLKDYLIKEYSNIYNLNKEEETRFFDEIINDQTPCNCCSMCNLMPLHLPKCMCGFHSHKEIKNKLDKLNCFENVSEFVKKFLSDEYKFVALPVKYGENNKWN